MFSNCWNKIIYIFLLFFNFTESYMYLKGSCISRRCNIVPISLNMCEQNKKIEYSNSLLYDRRNIMLLYIGTNLLGINSIYMYNNICVILYV